MSKKNGVLNWDSLIAGHGDDDWAALAVSCGTPPTRELAGVLVAPGVGGA
ncbi:MAG: hypothetical protein U0235_21120 [Polyangiaceae bacterium]